jgi:hypothetical protein
MNLKMGRANIHSSAFLALSRKPLALAGALVLILLLAGSFLARKNEFGKATGVQNLEATYHVLLTVKALESSPIQNHWLLPTVSLGGSRDKHIPWGATIPTKTGDYVYTSFTSPGFLAPYIVFGALNVEASAQNLARFNFALGSLVVLVLYALLFKILERCGYSCRVAVAGAVLGATASIFSKEVLQSHGLVYWSQCLYQLLLISGLYLLFAYLNEEPGQARQKNRYALGLVVVAFLGAWTEWTGYVYGGGLAILLWFGVFLERPQRGLAIKLVIAVAVAGLLTLVHYGLAAGFEPAVEAFMARFLARSSASGTVLDLLNGYALSFGLFLLATFVAAVLPFFLGSRKTDESQDARNKVAFLFFASSIPVLENFILTQHATQFSYDRLKAIFPAAIIVAVAFARVCNAWRAVLLALVLLASTHGFSTYRADIARYSAWPVVDSVNKLLAKALTESTNTKCSILFSDISVRGYSNLLFNRGIYEHISKKHSGHKVDELIEETQACSAVYLEGVMAFTDLPYYKSALVTKENGASFVLAPLDVGWVGSDYFLTDENWQNGVARRWAGFFVPNDPRLVSQLEKGVDVIFSNGTTRKIVEVRTEGQYLQVYLNGAPLNPAKIGPPTTYILRK